MAFSQEAKLQVTMTLKDEASKGFSKVAGEAEKADKSVGGLSNKLKAIGVGVAVGGVTALTAALGASAKMAAEEEVGIARLGQALQNSVADFDGNTAAIEKRISAGEEMAFADDALRDSLSELVARTHDVDKAFALQATAMDLARAKGIDLKTATMLVGKVYDGNVSILKRYGITVKEGATSTEALAAIQKMSAGQAQAYADTTAGAMDKIKIHTEDALEDIGGKVNDFLGASGPLLMALTTLPGLGKGLVAGIGGAWAFVSRAPEVIAAAAEAGAVQGAAMAGGESAGGLLGTFKTAVLKGIPDILKSLGLGALLGGAVVSVDLAQINKDYGPESERGKRLVVLAEEEGRASAVAFRKGRDSTIGDLSRGIQEGEQSFDEAGYSAGEHFGAAAVEASVKTFADRKAHNLGLKRLSMVYEAGGTMLGGVAAGGIVKAFEKPLPPDAVRAGMQPLSAEAKRVARGIFDGIHHAFIGGGLAIPIDLSKGINANHGLVEDAMLRLKWAILHPINVAKERTFLNGVLHGKALARGLHSQDPKVKQQAEDTRDLIQASLDKLPPAASSAGARAGAGFRVHFISELQMAVIQAQYKMAQLTHIVGSTGGGIGRGGGGGTGDSRSSGSNFSAPPRGTGGSTGNSTTGANVVVHVTNNVSVRDIARAVSVRQRYGAPA